MQIRYIKTDGIDLLKQWLAAPRELRSLILEPGDCTRYELYIIEEFNRFVIAREGCECFTIGKFEITPDYLEVFENLYTRCVVADVILMCLGLDPKYYDWERAQPCKS